MSISSSLNAGVAGLAANANRLSTISDNIANSNTYGYKRADTEFHSMVIANGTGTYSAGGVRVTSQRLIDQPGSLVTTANSTDLAVRGRGFLPVTTSAATTTGTLGNDVPFRLATTGSFRTDSQGFLTTETGMVLLGWPASADGTVPVFSRDTADALEPVRINVNQFAGDPTTRMELGVNLPATETEPGASGNDLELAVEYFDNLGTSQTVAVTFTPDVSGPVASNQWTMVLRDSASGGAIIGEYELIFDASRAAGGTLDSVNLLGAGGAYSTTTGSFTVNVAGGPIEISLGGLNEGVGMTQLSDSFAPTQITKDGSAVGNMISVDVDPSGLVKATFDSGITRTVYQIPLVDLPNPNGLQALDNQTYQTTNESGSFFLWDAGDGPTGDIVGFALEESATDVAAELTQLIQTQRAYSSNAKVIQTVDEMLQETTNIKR